ncbi:universal stress protein [Streptomyces sp. 549]|uniref:universal stress protein n=1 Tax=Streptomyces sp. 549 TaxID=3049076 RepID=UPI0024C348A6|nr:universal stress protein [Streptomyces sp. 549]MDK1472238.1 universal stress protein [Streptomyces sp. 549]
MTDFAHTTPLSPRVLVGFDVSEHSAAALERAAEEAVLRDAPLEILCGWPWELLPPEEGDHSGTTLHDRSRHLVEHAGDKLRERHPQLRVIPSMTSKAAAEALVHGSEGAVLTVVGSRGHGGFVGLLLGSVSLRVAAHTAGPLMVVRGDGRRDHNRVLLGVDGDTDPAAIEFAFEEAKRHGVELHVVHAFDFSPNPEDVQHEAAAQTIAQFAVAQTAEKYPDVRYRTETVQGPPGRELVKASKEADVIVVGGHHRKHRLGMQLGPVLHAVLHHSHCPVVLVPVRH